MSKKRRRSKYIESSDVGLVKEEVWKKPLHGRDTALLCSIRKSLIKKIPGLAEEFNKQSRYFGYCQGVEKDKAYIYVQKKNLRIDLCISRKHEKDLQNQGYIVKYHNNYQGKAGWLTGWRVPHNTKKINVVVKWLLKAFEGNL